MVDKTPTTPLVIRIATPEDIDAIQQIDRFSTSPTRHIHRDIEKYFGTVDPSTHEKTVIFLVEKAAILAAKAELMLPPVESDNSIGYIKRVIVHPDFRNQGLARTLMQHIILFARNTIKLTALELHVAEDNTSAIHLYESFGFEIQHRELYMSLPL